MSSRVSGALLLLVTIGGASAGLPGCGGGTSTHDAGGGAGGGSGGGGADSGMAGTGNGGGTSGAGGAAGAAGAGGGGTGGAACGGTTCTANQICVRPGCGLAIAVCVPLGDAGQCPTAWVMTDSCGSGTGPGCRPPVCDPPPPSCIDVPAACGGTPTCACLPGVCQPAGACAGITGGVLNCLSP